MYKLSVMTIYYKGIYLLATLEVYMTAECFKEVIYMIFSWRARKLWLMMSIL